MYCIGLTGQIASGKSTVAHYFSSLGVTVISADAVAKELTLKGEPAYQAILDYFGSEALRDDGELNRRYIRDRIFANPTDRLWLEQLLHPLIRERIITHINTAGTTPYCIIEIPLLGDQSNFPYLNRVLSIQTNPSIQLHRLMHRDHYSEQEALNICHIQTIAHRQDGLADDILDNNESRAVLEQRIKILHAFYLKEASAKKS